MGDQESWVLKWRGPDGKTGERQIDDAFTIGRSSSCDLVFDSPRISRTHARIGLSEKGRPVVEDLGSANGTLLNGDKTEAAFFNPGDRLIVGDIEFWVEEPAGATDALGAATAVIDPNATVTVALGAAPTAPVASQPAAPPPPQATAFQPQQTAPPAAPAPPGGQIVRRDPFGRAGSPAPGAASAPPPPPRVDPGLATRAVAPPPFQAPSPASPPPPPPRAAFGGPPPPPPRAAAFGGPPLPPVAQQQPAGRPNLPPPPGIGAGTYPVIFEASPPAPQSRLTVFFRGFMIFPHIVILMFLNIGVSFTTFFAFLAILFTGKMPDGMANFAAGFVRRSSRVSAYAYLLTGVYPPFDSTAEIPYPIRVDVFPQLTGRSRISCFFRGFLIIPNIVVFMFVALGAGFVYGIAWWVALFTGKVPEGMHNYLAGTLRWATRLQSYMLFLTDQYPPFSLQ